MLCVAEGVVLWPILVIWGHPEDALALALGVYALVLALDGRWTGAGWLFGAAVATQPLVILMLPVLLAMAGRQRALALLLRSALPAAVLLATPLMSQFHDTTQVLVEPTELPQHRPRHAVDTLCPQARGDREGAGGRGRPGTGRGPARRLSCSVGGRAVGGDRPDLAGVGGGHGTGPAVPHRIGDGFVLRVAHARPGAGPARANGAAGVEPSPWGPP